MLINRIVSAALLMRWNRISLVSVRWDAKTDTLAYRVAHLIEGGYAKARKYACA